MLCLIKFKNMKTSKHISIMLGISLATTSLFMGMLLWQNAQNQKIISEVLRKENKNSFSKAKPPVRKNESPSKIPEVSALTYRHSVSCLDNYENWRKSTSFRANAPWSTAFIRDSNISSPNNFNTDLNGDGLVDYVYVAHSNVGLCSHYGSTGGCQKYIDSYREMQDCVYLSNGNGWNLAYRCVSEKEKVGQNDIVYYYGDCAG